MAITDTFDNCSEEILKPSDMAKKINGFPETVIVTFSQHLLNILLAQDKATIISRLYAGIEVPIYQIKYKEKDIAFYLTWLGGPATVGLLEEIIIKGGRKILLFGSCGSLDRHITDGHIIVPTHAYRDEGTSYHYAPSNTGDFITVKTAPRLLEIFATLNIPVRTGKTWTTDAFYRETRKNFDLRKKAGCITVEMECASVMAMAQFRGIEAYQFLYTADNLDAKAWEPRLLGHMPKNMREKIVKIAMELAIRL